LLRKAQHDLPLLRISRSDGHGGRDHSQPREDGDTENDGPSQRPTLQES
jgi:hypothetical protein